MARNISLAAFDKKKEQFKARKNSEIVVAVNGGMKASATVAVLTPHNRPSLMEKTQKIVANNLQESHDGTLLNKDEGSKNEIKSLVIMNPSFNQSTSKNVKYPYQQQMDQRNSFKNAAEAKVEYGGGNDKGREIIDMTRYNSVRTGN